MTLSAVVAVVRYMANGTGAAVCVLMAQGVNSSHNHGGADRANNEANNAVYQGY